MSGVVLGVGVLNVVLGLVYFQYGTMTLWEMWRNRSTRGFSHFGAAWIAMAFTCGPHHLVHGGHVLFEGRTGGLLDLIVVAVGFPAGVIWFLLRVEAFAGGRGDRFIEGSPLWVIAMPTISAVYLTIVGAALIGGGSVTATGMQVVLPNLMLVFLYMAIGYFLARTQIANRHPLGGWSVSGLALTVVFPTCAVMHGIYAYYVLTGLYVPDWHGLGIDWIAVPAAMYFLWVVRALYKGTFVLWKGAPTAPAAEPALEPAPQTVPAGG